MTRTARSRASSAAPFAAAACAPYLLLLPAGGWAAWPLLGSAVLTLSVGAVLVFCRWERWPDWAALGPALAYLLAVVMLRESGGGNDSGVGPMVLLPVIWLALHGTRRVLAAVLVAVPLVYWVPVLVEGGAAYPDNGWPIGMLFAVLSTTLGLTVQRLHDRVRAQAARMDELAHQDELTGLPNRRAWLAQLDRALATAARHGEPVAVALVDIDRFKAVNDAGGHEAGDALLAAAARVWGDVLRGGDVLARMGGDEFALLLPHCDAAEACDVLARMRRAPLAATWSAGVTMWDGEEGRDALVRRADTLLYDAKRSGRDRVRSEVRAQPLAACAT